MPPSIDPTPPDGQRPFGEPIVSKTSAGDRTPESLDATLPPEGSSDPIVSHQVSPPPRSDPALSQTLAPDAASKPPPKSDPVFSQTLQPEEAPHGERAYAPHAGSFVHVSVNNFPVTKWERYDFLKLLGQGGMGAVYQARDKRLNRTVALKFIRGGDPNLVMRFMQEARTQARIDHPHICKVYEVGEVQGQAYIAMQFVDGKPLDKASASLSLTEKVVIMQKVSEAMHEAHRLGIIHRDLKPSNIMIERAEDGSLSPVVMDFGVARESGEERGLTETGTVMGTPAYMAPEQARGETRSIDRRSDVYSLGATLYDLIVGIPPFDAQSVVDLLLKVVSEDAPPLRTRIASIPPDLETIVMKCLNKEPNQRYDSAKALAEDLGFYLNGEPILGRRMSMVARLKRRARRNRTLVAVSVLSAVVVLFLGGGALRQYFANQRERHRMEELARTEQRLAEDLGQEITKMEWVLRSARQLPLHDLSREKVIIRERMAQLQSELKGYGELSRALGHYALGRGHMALHEYPQALEQLRKAMQLGKEGPDVDYALGFVLGKHFEQAMYEARLSGGGDWAKRQLKEIEPKYLVPAIESLQRSRAVKLDSPKYLEGLIAYYRRDFENALLHADAALIEAPWLYEAHKLKGDVHFERALAARDSGKYPEAEKEFAGAVQSYEAASAIGQSDSEVYEGLAESWVRQIEMSLNRGQPTEVAYAAAVSAGDKSSIAEPQSVNGLLKKAYANLLTMGVSGSGLSFSERIQQCINAAQEVLRRHPGNPYASDVAACCHDVAADAAVGRGEDPEPLLRQALALLEPAVQKYPYFLWGINDVASTYAILGSYFQLHGNPSANQMLDKSLDYIRIAANLDDTYITAAQNALDVDAKIAYGAISIDGLNQIMATADKDFDTCVHINNQWQQCYINYLIFSARAARQLFQAGSDPQPRLAKAMKSLASLRKLGGSFLDMEQHTVLAHLVEAKTHVRRGEDPAPALTELRAALNRCFALAAKDATCRSMDAEAEQVQADWLVHSKQSPTQALRRALEKANLATKSPETYPDAWQVLAEAHLRLSKATSTVPLERGAHLEAALAALEHVFAINPSHQVGRATQGVVRLLQAQTARTPAAQKLAAQQAVQSLERALQQAPLIAPAYDSFLRRARELAAAQGNP